jgi:hypothetical protein
MLLLGGGALAAAAGFVVSQQSGTPGLVTAGSAADFGGLGAALVGGMQLLAASRDQRASAGEGPVVTQLQARLGDDYTYLRRVTIPHHAVEADGVLVGPGGALVLAIRELDGDFAVRGDDWFRVGPDGAQRSWDRSPTWELARPMRALLRAMQEEGLPAVPIRGAVVLSRGRLVEAVRPSAAVVPLDRIGRFVDYLRDSERAPPAAVDRLLDFLEPHAGG